MNVLKRSNELGNDIKDASHLGHLTKYTKIRGRGIIGSGQEFKDIFSKDHQHC
jgi:hypothetical protein